MLDHYLEVLARKPGALGGATALKQAREQGVFTATHDRFWAQARRDRGDGAGTRALVEVLLLHRTLPAEAIGAGIDAALRVGSTDPALVAIEARRLTEAPLAPVVPIREALARYERPTPGLDGYDSLLTQPATIIDLEARR